MAPEPIGYSGINAAATKTRVCSGAIYRAQEPAIHRATGQKKYRKFTRLKNYDYNTNGYYFVTICTAMRKPWLEIHKTAVETILKDIPERFTGINIDFYSIVSDHLHVIFTLNNANTSLGEVVRTFKALVTKSTGCKPFWEWSYYEHIIRDEKALYNIRKYILENPLKETIDWDNIYSGINAAATKTRVCSGAIYRAQEPAIYRANKGVTLIIVVFAMMLFGVLGWTLARMQATDFESNLRTFEPENALNLAEAGAQWALNRLSANPSCRSQSGLLNCPPLASPAIDTDCTDAGDWLSAPHSLSPGQYNLCVRNPCATCTPGERGNVVIVSRGYIPSQSGSRTMRQIKLEVAIGSLTNAVQTQTADPDDTSVGLFNWSAANNFPPTIPAHNPTQIEGAISAGHYEGDDDAEYDELPPGNPGPGYDYDPPPGSILPDDDNNPENDIRDFSASYPSISMQYFHDNATNYWPNSINRPLTTTITLTNGGNDLEAAAGFFEDADEYQVAVRRNVSGWWNNNSDWSIITFVNGSGSTATVNPPVAWGDEDLDTGGIQVNIKLLKCFYLRTYSGQRWYVGRAIDEGPILDTEALIYLANRPRPPGGGGPPTWTDINFTNSSIIAEGDIVIKGGNEITMDFSGGAIRYPNLGTQDGKIISKDQPSPGGEVSRRNQRNFEGLIYSQNKEVNFNYLDGRLVYGKQVILDGTVRIRYTNGRITSGGFVFEPSTLTWKEE